MKKHFTGIALFIFIVGISGFVASLFNEIPKPEVFEVQNTIPVYQSKKRCSKKYRDYSSNLVAVNVTQAVYNEKGKQLFVDFVLDRGNSTANFPWINLHFYIKTANGVKYLTTEQINFLPEFAGKNNANDRAALSFLSLNELDSHENLYVIADPATFLLVKENGTDYVPKFDESKAAAVLVAKD